MIRVVHLRQSIRRNKIHRSSAAVLAHGLIVHALRFIRTRQEKMRRGKVRIEFQRLVILLECFVITMRVNENVGVKTIGDQRQRIESERAPDLENRLVESSE